MTALVAFENYVCENIAVQHFSDYQAGAQPSAADEMKITDHHYEMVWSDNQWSEIGTDPDIESFSDDGSTLGDDWTPDPSVELVD